MADENNIDIDINNNTNAPIMNDGQTDIETWKQRWANRRKMAWAAFMSMFVITLVLFFGVPVEKLNVLSDVVVWFYGTMASIILGYMGSTTSAFIFARRRGS